MPHANPKLEWAIIRLGSDMNWWVEEISDKVHWDTEGLGIIDPRQAQHILESCEPLRDYGFDFDHIENAFFTFRIDKEEKNGNVRLARVKDSIIESDEPIFALPDVMDEEKGPYADFLDQITRFRVKILNDMIDFDQSLTVDELEEDLRDRQNSDFMEGRATHFFNEITSILEYIPEGYEAEFDDELERRSSEDEDIAEIPDFEDDEKIEEDETMKWDEDDGEDDFEDDDDEKDDDDEDDDDEEDEDK